MNKTIYFDTETTGFLSDDHSVREKGRLIQLAWQVYEGSKLLEEESFLVRQDACSTMNEKAFAVHGISLEKADKEGYTCKSVLQKFLKAANGCKHAVAHNMSFDDNAIAKELFLLKSIEAIEFWNGIPKKCSKLDTTAFCNLKNKQGKPKWPTLQELHIKCFGIGFEGAHDALADVKAMAKCCLYLNKISKK